MVVAMLVTLTVAATAFVIYMRQVDRAASNVRDAAQAELAARSGLEHGIRAVEEALGLYLYVYGDAATGGAVDASGVTYTNPAPPPAGDGAKAGWYRYFAGTEEIVAYDSPGHVVKGLKFEIIDAGSVKRGEYAVAVVDLDGKLHADLDRWKLGHPSSADVPQLLEDVALVGLGTTGTTEALLFKEHSTDAASYPDARHLRAFSSLGEMARRADADTVAKGKYRLESVFTVYPVRGLDAVTADVGANTPGPETSEIALTGVTFAPGEHVGGSLVFQGSVNEYPIKQNTASAVTVFGSTATETATQVTLHVPRPAVNVNTATEALLAEFIEPVPSFDADPLGEAKALALAKHLVARRPFTSRHELEEAVRRVSGDDHVEPLPGLADPDDRLSERQFNDVLNGFAGVLAENESAYDEPGTLGTPGVYSFDGWAPFKDGVGPAQTGGECSAPDGNPAVPVTNPAANVTWSTELKFTSRFFHVYVLGRGWNVGTNEAAGIRRLHAIYDAKAKRIVWLRWNLSSRGSVTDIN